MSPARRVAAIVGLLALGGCGTRGEPEPLTVGQVVTLSGPQKTRGERARDGAALGLEVSLRGDRRVFGRRVVLRHVDDRGDAELVQPEAVRMLTLNRAVALLGGPEREANERLARAVQSYGVPVLLPADLAEIPVGESIVCLNAAPATRGDALARFAADELHWKRVVALVDARDAAAGALAKAFLNTWRRQHPDDKDAGAEEWFCGGDEEWDALVKRAAADRPDGLLVATGAEVRLTVRVVEPKAAGHSLVPVVTGPEAFLKVRTRLAAADYKGPVLYGGEDRGAAEFTDARDEGPATFLATAFAARADLGPEGKAFVEAYERKFQERPDLDAALAFDGVRILIDALERAKTAQPVPLTDELHNLKEFPGVTGPLSLAERRAKRRLFVVKVEKGEAKVVRAPVPGGE
jgi:branched-chain amino acid transport system substrate-binding protein